MTSTLTKYLISLILRAYNARRLTPHSVARFATIAVIVARERFGSRFDSLFRATSRDHAAIVRAFVCSYTYTLFFRDKLVTLAEWLRQYAIYKMNAFYGANDYGAFGDLLEVCARIIARKSVNLVHYYDLYTRAQDKVDLTIKGLRYDVAHNGKSLTAGNPDDFMHGSYEGVIYGVFDSDMQADIFGYFAAGDYRNGLDYVSDCLYVWENKYDFRQDMDTLSRGAGITYKETVRGGFAQVVYNPSKHKAFIKACDRFTTLKDFI